jgi:TrmH family RNA methyltransferase
MTQYISSTHNVRVQEVRALLNQKSARTESGCFVVEGVRLAEEALASGRRPTHAFFSKAVSERGLKLIDQLNQQGVEVFELSEGVMEALSATESSQGILLVMQQSEEGELAPTDFVLVLDQIRDPGNLGTILRSASAAGVKVVFLPPATADAFAPKVVRAGMGAHFRLSIRNAEWAEIVQYCKQTCQPPLRMLLAESGGGQDCWHTDLKTPLALVIGGEADGASLEARLAMDGLIYIPMPGEFESLNAAVAAGILIFEVVRQRSPL